MQGNKNNLHNHFWHARKRLGLGQKQVAYLLGQKTTDQVSRYEKGLRVPSLKTFLQFEIIYGTPARVLYRGLYDELRTEIEVRARSFNNDRGACTVSPSRSMELYSEYCGYEELLRTPAISQPERDKVRKHVVTLMRRLNEL